MDPFQLPDWLQQKALEELGETPEIRTNALNEFRNRIICELPEYETTTDLSDRNLIRFLRCKKYNLDKAMVSFREIKHYYHEHQALLMNIQPEEFNHLQSFVCVIRDADPDGRVLVSLRPKQGINLFTPEYVQQHPHSLFRFNIYLFEQLHYDPQVQICGLLFINIFENFTFWDQLALKNIAPIKEHIYTFKYLHILGFRLKGFYIFNEPAIFDWLWYFIHPLLSKTIRERFHICGQQYEIIHELIPDQQKIPMFLFGLRSMDDIQHWNILPFIPE